MARQIDAARRWLEANLWLLLIPLAWPAVRPFYREGLTRSFDSGLHMLRIGALDRYVREGMLLPRWTPDLLLGYGYPLLNFYAPATYYVAEAMVLMGLDVYHAFVLTMACFALAAGVGMYFLSLDVYGGGQRLPALLAATAYLYGPYLLTNVYIRGALAEVGAQALLPWVLLFARRLFTSQRPEAAFLPFSLALGLLALTHNITMLFAPPLLVAYLLLHWLRTGRPRDRGLWALAGIATAMCISMFFWLPLIAERRYVSEAAYEIARTVWLPSGAWTWETFLDRGLTFSHSFDRPVRLGMLQLALALAGFVLARRRDAEWLFFAGVAVTAVLLISAVSLPLWQAVEILAVAQFPWRLLSILSLPLALFAGGIGLALPRGRPRVAGVAIVLAVLVFFHMPRLTWMDVYAPETASVSAAVFAQTEVEKGALGGGEGNSSIQEFRPRWADRTLLLEGDALPAVFPAITVESATSWSRRIVTAAERPTSLRFTDFYFPGWRIVLDGERELPAFPTTNLGLLTVDLPAGTHTLSVEWAGTSVQRTASVVSLFALAAAALAGWRLRTRYWAAGAALAFGFGLLGMLVGPVEQQVERPYDVIQTEALTLAGYRVVGPERDVLTIYPYWTVRERPHDGLRFRWAMLDGNGALSAESVAIPFYNSYGAENWPATTLADDAVMMRVPPGAPAGRYRLVVAVERAADGEVLSHGDVGEIDFTDAIDGSPVAESPVVAQFGDSVRLAGYEILSPKRVKEAGRGTPVLEAGDYVRLSLLWQGVEPVPANYHTFIHLLDHQRLPLVQEDQLPGPLFQPPRLWDRMNQWPDVYLLRLPKDAESGLYWPAIGMYEHETEDRLPVYIGDGTADDALMPPVKILGMQGGRPEHKLEYRLGELAEVPGYDLEPRGREVTAGTPLTVTLHYQSIHPTESDLIRFVQLIGPDGVAAQHDSPPANGANPTWAWVEGERVRDTVTLQTSADVEPGVYQLFAGMYDRGDSSRRVTIYDDNGDRVTDDWISLGSVTITEPSR